MLYWLWYSIQTISQFIIQPKWSTRINNWNSKLAKYQNSSVLQQVNIMFSLRPYPATEYSALNRVQWCTPLNRELLFRPRIQFTLYAWCTLQCTSELFPWMQFLLMQLCRRSLLFTSACSGFVWYRQPTGTFNTIWIIQPTLVNKYSSVKSSYCICRCESRNISECKS